MIRKLSQYNLELEPTLTYVQENLKWANTLSLQLLKLVDFGEGIFFTYLAPDTEEDKIYQFPYSISSNVINTEEVASFINDYLIKNSQISCLFEDTIRKPTDTHLEEFHECGVLYNDEIYYLVDQNNLDRNLILECLRASSAIWHSLCILTKINFNRKHSLTLDMINASCMKIEVAIIGAYDDEGYIFWKRNR